MARIVGRFCKRVLLPKSAFDKRSFRWKKSGQAWVLVGCPKGTWKNDRCAVGTRAHVVLSKSSRRCGVGRTVVRKGLSSSSKDRVSDLDVYGHKFHIDEKGNTRRVSQHVETNRSGDWGADPVGDGTFRMHPSGDVVSLEERNRRLKKR